MRLRYFLLLTLFIGLSACASLAADKCSETIVIDSVEYPVGERWCGKKIDSTDLADRDRLRRIPEEYCFEDSRIYVDSAARDAFVKMAETARKDSLSLMVDSGYRSAGYQAKIISNHLADGDSFADIIRYVAPPGYSEHETGRVVDMVPSDAGFGRTKAYLWLKENAGQFRFYETFPNDSMGLMPWEPWHWAYIPD